MSVTLGIDIGTSGTKTIAIDESGAILASSSVEYPCDHPKPGWSEQHPDLWWQATVATVRYRPTIDQQVRVLKATASCLPDSLPTCDAFAVALTAFELDR